MKSILIICEELPHKPFHGGIIRVFHTIKHLSKSNKVTLLALSKSRDNFNPKELKKYCKVITAPTFIEEFFKLNKFKFLDYLFKASILKIRRALPIGSKLINKQNYKIFCLNKELKKIIKKKHFDYIQVEHSWLAHVLDKIKTDSIKIIVFHNVCSYMNYNPREKRLIGKDEKKIKNMYNLAICCSQIEKNRLESLGYKKIIVVPNGVDTNYFKFTNTKKPSSLLFIGNLFYKPNIEAVKYFIKEIYPYLNIKLPLHIIGEHIKKTFRKESKLKNIYFHGFVKDIRPYFKSAIFICPILDGGGTRIKILTAFASGCPVVSTSKGAEGINCIPEKDILIADSPKTFINQIQKLMSDFELYKKIRKNARLLAEKKYDWKIIINKYNKELNKK